MKIITPLQEFLVWIIENWPAIMSVFALGYAIYKKIIKLYSEWQIKTDEEKDKIIQEEVNRAKKMLGEIILSYVSVAEIDWQSEGGKLGQIKRSQVISQIMTDFPVLSYVTDQEELLAYIDKLIDEALVIVREKIRTETGAEQA